MINSNNKRLIILSDLWGKEKAHWFDAYDGILSPHFNLVFYDSAELAEIDQSIYEESELHQQFVQGGIERAVSQLIQLEKDPIHILAFSVGGVIAWKYGLQKKLLSLTAVSSTRLRKETQKPAGSIHLYFGSEDPYSPSPDWFKEMGLPNNLVKGATHQVYQEPLFAQRISQILMEKIL